MEGVFSTPCFFPINCFVLEPIFSKIGDISNIQTVRNKKSKLGSHRYLIEFYETNQMSHISHLYDIIINTYQYKNNLFSETTIQSLRSEKNMES